MCCIIFKLWLIKINVKLSFCWSFNIRFIVCEWMEGFNVVKGLLVINILGFNIMVLVSVMCCCCLLESICW